MGRLVMPRHRCWRRTAQRRSETAGCGIAAGWAAARFPQLDWWHGERGLFVLLQCAIQDCSACNVNPVVP